MRPIPYEELSTLIHQKIPLGMFRSGRSPARGIYPGQIYLPAAGLHRVPWLMDIFPPDIQGVIESADEHTITTFSMRYAIYAKFERWIPSAYFQRWQLDNSPDYVITISPIELAIEIRTARNTGTPIEIIDLRHENDHSDASLPYGVLFHPMEILDQLDKVPDDQVYYVLCEDGEAALCFATVMKRFGFHNFYPVEDGWKGLSQLPTTEDFVE